MGIYDRDYSRPRGSRGMADPGGRRPGRMSRWSVNTWLIVINIAVFVMQGFLQKTRMIMPNFASDPLEYFGHFSSARAFFFYSQNPQGGANLHLTLEVWRFVTFQFLHANLSHIFFNMFGLFIFGGMVEEYLGRKKYLAFYLTCGIFGALAYLLLNMVGFLINDPRTPLIGASAGVFGVIVACAYIQPNMIVQLLFPPIPLKMKWMAYGYVGLAALNLLTLGTNAGGDAAHIGGAVAGFFFIRNSHLLRDFFDVFQNSNKPKKPRPTRRRTSAGRGDKSERGKARKPSEDEVDRVLRKVSASGLHSLTKKERQILSRASEE
ncbi:MAG: rhomboid family intramembrane serine protease [Phycisphaerales bacterium JB040]